jgi:hypothetical protein
METRNLIPTNGARAENKYIYIYYANTVNYDTEPSKYNKRTHAVFVSTEEKSVDFCGMTWCNSADGYYCFGGTCRFKSSLNTELNALPLVTAYETTVS